MSSQIGRGWRRSLEIYGVLFASLGVGSSLVHVLVKPDMSVPAALNLDVDAEQLRQSDSKKQ